MRLLSLDRLFSSVDRSVILRSLATCVDGGHTLSVGLNSLAASYPRLWIRGRLERVLERLKQGTSWQECLRRHSLIRRTDASVLTAAEWAGNLAWAMRELADRCERRFAHGIDVLTQLLLPVLVLGVGAVIFLFAIAFFCPLVKLISELSG